MLIVSKFHDYYDTASVHGVDKTCVYKRDKSFVEVKRVHWGDPEFIKLPDGDRFNIPESFGSDTLGIFDAHRMILGFCGEFFPVVILERHNWSTAKPERYAFYSYQRLSDFLESRGMKPKTGTTSRYNRYRLDTFSGISNFFDTNALKKYNGLFHAYKTPIFLFSSHNPDGPIRSGRLLVLNPNLKSIGFMKVKDPQTAFQDVFQFMSGVIGNTANPMVSVSDKDKAAKYGHDDKYSFKKPPGKKVRWR